MFRVGMRLAVFVSATWAFVASGQDGLKRLSTTEAANAIVSRVQPEYPAMARQLKLDGKVELEAVVSEQGAVEDVHIIKGNPVLTKAAVDAVKKWKFSSFTEGGKPVKALAPINLEFKRVDK